MRGYDPEALDLDALGAVGGQVVEPPAVELSNVVEAGVAGDDTSPAGKTCPDGDVATALKQLVSRLDQVEQRLSTLPGPGTSSSSSHDVLPANRKSSISVGLNHNNNSDTVSQSRSHHSGAIPKLPNNEFNTTPQARFGSNYDNVYPPNGIYSRSDGNFGGLNSINSFPRCNSDMHDAGAVRGSAIQNPSFYFSGPVGRPLNSPHYVERQQFLPTARINETLCRDRPSSNVDARPNTIESMSNRCGRGEDNLSVRVKTFNPKESDWFSYRQYFTYMARLAGWSDRIKCLKLMGALDGQLAGITTGLTQDISFDGLLDRLDAVHGVSTDQQYAMAQLETVSKKSEESVALYAERIRQLVERACPSYSASDKDAYALKVFLKGLPSANEFRFKMRSQMFSNLREAVLYGAHLEHVFRMERSSDRGLERGHRPAVRSCELDEDDISAVRKMFNQLGNSLNNVKGRHNAPSSSSQVAAVPPSGQLGGQQDGQRGNQREPGVDTAAQKTGSTEQRPRFTPENSPCSYCYQLGHWRKDCPQRAKDSVVRICELLGNSDGDDLN